MLQRRTTVLVGVLAVVLVTMGVFDYGNAAPKEKPRFYVSSNDPNWVWDRTTGLQWYIRADVPGYTGIITPGIDCNLGSGARLPQIKELLSLVDYGVAYPGPVLPAGHPFLNVQDYYWSATLFEGHGGQYWLLDLRSGAMYPSTQVSSGWVWCVR